MATHVLRARDRANRRQVVLIVDHYVPQPDRDAGSRTMVTFIRALLGSGVVVKFWPLNLSRTPGYTEALQDIGVEVMYRPHQIALSDWLKVNGADHQYPSCSIPAGCGGALPARGARQWDCGKRSLYYGHDLSISADRLERKLFSRVTPRIARRRRPCKWSKLEFGGRPTWYCIRPRKRRRW